MSLKYSGLEHEIIDFFPFGYDDDNFAHQDLICLWLFYEANGHYSEYHTSADNLNFAQPQHLCWFIFKCLSAWNIIENNKPYLNQNPKCVSHA